MTGNFPGFAVQFIGLVESLCIADEFFYVFPRFWIGQEVVDVGIVDVFGVKPFFQFFSFRLVPSAVDEEVF